MWPGLSIDDLKQRTLKFFGPGSEYDTPVNDPYRERGGKKTIQYVLLKKNEFTCFQCWLLLYFYMYKDQDLSCLSRGPGDRQV